ncbi:hydrogenase nickel incorporation protein HypB [Elizabethkingia sp. JS20170427COW]|uniref:hydrogenase nickel incorporation protein HypB n=1 Tax=Elizabethkingia sp. JS20170427COW TaxID=2583851 RepID=UPI0011102432|nr:hydrogenase nickel incorporation protein HypB [Elizabethkingia sp. JS20170427COW]QCX52565.1 hydrogenase nickel incorporation protein HypB [Elizabethkingia sp. JS20170427COW]
MSINTPKSLGNRVGSLEHNHTILHLLKANDFVAKAIREKLKNICVINVCSSPGSGKTTLMQETGKKLAKDLNISILVGDPETERDAVRMREVGINAMQIVTGGMCHIEAQMILQALDHFDIEGTDLLFIENVGNLLCPSAFDLREDYRVTLLASTEGDDKPKKYHRMFLTSELMLVSKSDLLPHVPFSVEAVTKDAREVNPNIEVLTLSSLNGDGMEEWCNWLKEKVKQKKKKLLKKFNLK